MVDFSSIIPTLLAISGMAIVAAVVVFVMVGYATKLYGWIAYSIAIILEEGSTYHGIFFIIPFHNEGKWYWGKNRLKVIWEFDHQYGGRIITKLDIIGEKEFFWKSLQS